MLPYETAAMRISQKQSLPLSLLMKKWKGCPALCPPLQWERILLSRTQGVTQTVRRPLQNPISILFLLLINLILIVPLSAQQETVYMSVLNSRRHRIGALDNPTVGLFLSTDAGVSWQHRGWGYTRTFYAESGLDGTIWSACGNGVLRSTDGGATWRITTGWEITEVLRVKADPRNPATVYAATAYGIFKTTDSGESWQEKNQGFRKAFTSDIVIDRTNGSLLFAGTEEGIYRSTDGGNRWSPVGAKPKGIRTVVQDPHRAQTFWAGTENDGAAVSRDEGKTWQSAHGGMKHLTVYTITFDPAVSGTVYVGTHGGGVHRSLDDGRTWKQCSKGLNNLVVHSLVVLPSNPRIILAGTLNGGLFRSTDGGDHWNFNSQEEGQAWGLSVR